MTEMTFEKCLGNVASNELRELANRDYPPIQTEYGRATSGTHLLLMAAAAKLDLLDHKIAEMEAKIARQPHLEKASTDNHESD